MSCTSSDAESTSPIDAPLMTSGVSSFVACPVATVLTGASFVAVTSSVVVWVLLFVSPSFTVQLIVRWSVEGVSEVFVYCTAWSAAM